MNRGPWHALDMLNEISDRGTVPEVCVPSDAYHPNVVKLGTGLAEGAVRRRAHFDNITPPAQGARGTHALWLGK